MLYVTYVQKAKAAFTDPQSLAEFQSSREFRPEPENVKAEPGPNPNLT